MAWANRIAETTTATERAKEQLLGTLRDIDVEMDAETDAVERARTFPPPKMELCSISDRLVDEAADIYAQQQGRTLPLALAGLLTRAEIRSGGMTAIEPRPELPWDLTTALPFGAWCWLDGEAVKASLRRRITAATYEEGPSTTERPKLLERHGRKLAELNALREALVDKMIALGIAVTHREEVVQRRAAEARAREREEQQARERAFLDDARARGELGTPRARQARMYPTGATNDPNGVAHSPNPSGDPGRAVPHSRGAAASGRGGALPFPSA